jgi:outer membrane immunogenic protein
VKLIALASAFSLAVSGLATAADLPSMKPAPAPPPYAFSWNGLYIGGFAGGAWTSHATTSDPCLVGVACAFTGTYNGVPPLSYTLGRSFTGGAEIGYNWQAMPNLLLGVEDKLGYMNLSGSRVMNPPGIGNSDTVAHASIGNWYDVYTARIGLIANNQWLLFVEGGGVTANMSQGVIDTTLPVTINSTTSKTVTSWAFGGGLEYAIDNNWSIKGELMSFGLHNRMTGCSQVGGFPAGTIDCNYTKLGNVSTATVGLNYRFSLF